MQNGNSRIEALEARRLLSAGSLDTAFGSGGVAYPPLAGKPDSEQIAFQSDGKMIIAAMVTSKGSSSTELELLRLTSKGQLDSTFGNSGDVTLRANASNWTMLQLNSADQIYVQIGQKLIRFSSDGKTQTTVANTSKLATATGLGITEDESILNNGKIIVQKNNTIERLKPNGSLDTSFGNDGKVTIVLSGPMGAPMEGTGMTIQHDGGILVWEFGEDLIGDTQSGIQRITSSGQIDQSYGDAGFVNAFDGVASVVNLSGGAIAVLTETVDADGGANGSELFELDANGNLESSFDDGGIRDLALVGPPQTELTQAVELLGLPNGKFVTVLRHSDDSGDTFDTFQLTRLNADGSFDNSFNSTARVQISADVNSVLPTPGGDVVAYGIASSGKHAGQLELFRYSGSPPVSTSSIATLSSAGTLNIFGTAHADRIQVTEDMDDTIDIIDCIVNGKEAVFSGDGVKSIIIHAGAGDDDVSAEGAPIGVTIIGDDGNDTLTGGGLNDAIHGGAGDDSINGGNGNDTLWGDAGNDTLLGGDGNDRLNANDGQVDSLDGGEGRDMASIDQSDPVSDDVLNVEKIV